MRNYRNLLLPILLLLAGCLSGQSQNKPISLQYLTPDIVRSINLPAVPQQGAALYESDFKTLHEWQNKRTEAQCEEAEKDAEYMFVAQFPMMKEFYNSLPQQNKDFINSVGDETSASVSVLKDKYGRKRPFVIDNTLSPCISKPRKGSLSYPSGHTAAARVYALLLTELVPEKRAEFFTRADDIALSRVIGGVHYPTDIDAGKRLANELFQRYMQNKLFRANVNDLRQYLK